MPSCREIATRLQWQGQRDRAQLTRAVLDLGDMRLEYRMIGPRPGAAPTIVMLHEGLGCVGLWGDFPDKLQAATGAGVFVYSRAGYGKSSPAALPRPLTFMHDEARDVLPRLLDAIGFRRGLAARPQRRRLDRCDLCRLGAGPPRARARADRAAFLHRGHGHRRDRAREGGLCHDRPARKSFRAGTTDVDNAFRGWNDAWLDPDFRQWDITDVLAYIRVPILVVQGADDQYGTVAQVEAVERECYCPVEVALLPGVRHVAASRGAGCAAQGGVRFRQPAAARPQRRGDGCG